MAYLTCTNPTCNYPGEKFEEHQIQKWCPRCRWPLSARCPACGRELTKEIVKYRNCTCGESLLDHYCELHIAGLMSDNADGDMLLFVQSQLARIEPRLVLRLLMPDMKELSSFWENSNDDFRKILQRHAAEQDLFAKDNLVKISEYQKKKS